ncbi:MAG TPA: hypothetical protein ENJ09_15720 [Planctomycetes bacterium]|nr:hypothetical protein [Planctomycetota bacterium]
MTKSLRFTLGAGLLLAGLLSGCRSGAGDPSSHWNIDSVDNRIVKHFTGYRGPMDGSYLEYQDQKKRDIGKTLRRHFLNDNPDNPFEVDDPDRYEARSPYGPLPDPVHWFNVESIFMGAIASGWSGTFVPIPLDSVLALFSEGGTGEFYDSMTGDWEPITNRPPSVSSFRVKHR